MQSFTMFSLLSTSARGWKHIFKLSYPTESQTKAVGLVKPVESVKLMILLVEFILENCILNATLLSGYNYDFCLWWSSRDPWVRWMICKWFGCLHTWRRSMAKAMPRTLPDARTPTCAHRSHLIAWKTWLTWYCLPGILRIASENEVWTSGKDIILDRTSHHQIKSL